MNTERDSYRLFVNACKAYHIPIDGSNISWEGEKGKEWYDGWGDRPGSYERYDNSGYNEPVSYKTYFEEYLDNLNIDVEDLSEKEFEKYFLAWAEDEIELGSWADKITFGDLVSEHNGDRDCWWETKKSPFEDEE